MPTFRFFLLFLTIWFTTGAAALAAEGPRFLGIGVGLTTRAEVELLLGDAVERIGTKDDPFGLRPEQSVYAYRPPKEAPEAKRILVEFFPDTGAVARLDVVLATPLGPAPLRQHFGTLIVTRQTLEGASEEFFYPKLQGLRLTDSGPEAAVTAISYLSPRYLADVFADRFNEHKLAGRLEDARTEGQKAVLVAPDYARGHLSLALYYWDTKKIPEAMEHLERAAGARYSASKKAQARAWLGRLHWEEKHAAERAEAEFREALGLAPDLYLVHLEYGRFLYQQGQKDTAVAELDRAASLDPDARRGHLEVADFLYQHKEYDRALPHLEAIAASRGPDLDHGESAKNRATFAFRLAYCRAQTGRREDAIQSYREALRWNPRMAMAYNNMGYQLASLGQTEEAVAAYEAGLAIEPDGVFLSANLTEALLQLGDCRRALYLAQKTMDLDPDNPRRKLAFARAWAGLGDKKKALHWIREAVSAGYRDSQQLQQEPLFNGLRKKREFKNILKDLETGG